MSIYVYITNLWCVHITIVVKLYIFTWIFPLPLEFIKFMHLISRSAINKSTQIFQPTFLNKTVGIIIALLLLLVLAIETQVSCL